MAAKVVRAEHIKDALSKKHTVSGDEVFLTEVKTGPTQVMLAGHELCILDAVAIKKSWTRPCITAYEVKVSRSDFMRDTKWPAYRKYCHRLAFACPTGLIQKEELPDDIGLVWYDPETGKLTTKRSPLFREVELPTAMFYHLIISHMKSDRHPFFTSERQYWEAFLEDKHDKRLLGYHVKGKLREYILGLERKIARADVLEGRVKKYEEFMKALNDVTRPLGVWFNPIFGWGYERELVNLKNLLTSSGGVAKKVVERVHELQKVASSLLELIPGGE